MVTKSKLSRRGFLIGTAAIGGAMVVNVGTAARQQEPDDLPAAGATGQPGGVEMAARLVINPDDSITVRSTKPEAGQGTTTTLAVFVCEELGSDPLDESLVRIEWA